MPAAQLQRLVEVMHRLRRECPWDAEQTHESLVGYLVEETLEVVEAIEQGSDDALAEELGDLLLQVVFHAEIAAQQSRFTLDDVARGIADKLIARHPYVFADADVPDDLLASWEQRKRAEKGRTSALDGIPDRMSALTRAGKVLARAGSHGVPVSTDASAADIGERMLALVVEANDQGIDAEQATRAAVRRLEQRIVQAESTAG
ncbi:MazG family protein [Micropruina glycogenica]|uniref:Uncharacterized 26.1 kDa protein in blaB 3'region n=1 Tax=Micropruina glycogenica TaxID=75385 RepID=A0A2N9JMW7_9ACTN|nr:Uncharacterized 26.1 kDa protein in blaB 3'region [Micropruina glycogenica]